MTDTRGADAQRRKRQRHRDNGLCDYCGRVPPRPGCCTCHGCGVRAAARTKRWQARQPSTSRLKRFARLVFDVCTLSPDECVRAMGMRYRDDHQRLNHLAELAADYCGKGPDPR